ncbi:hypothetical protein HPB49_016858 [Dermacentor silvarum]|uniref:Uncharacterized protein n=2 Tax=Dermacentor silvarum TaxID=543639 RepID=A0ACB8DF25_DERSI|nr:hypothetical protein HPB49_016858 [Dermacentor silvarum]
MYRRWKDSKGADKEYENIIRKCVADSRLEAEKDGVRIPTTVDDYVVKRQQPKQPAETSTDLTDIFYDTTDDDTGD